MLISQQSNDCFPNYNHPEVLDDFRSVNSNPAFSDSRRVNYPIAIQTDLVTRQP